MSPRVGVVIVSYNASQAVRVTLASLREARNDVACEVVLVDNASRDEERAAIRRALDRHVAEAGLPWTFVQQGDNLGFSGGNNVGIRRLLADGSITHVCLLNSDVVVPHHWLDHLLAAGKDVVSAVTNKSESEQCVPIDYEIELDTALDAATERLRPGVFAAVDAFAARRRRAFAGHVEDCDATFFCVLIRREVFERIGELDETFFPGGYEDDDYCLRARKAGYPVHVARDLFLHHWGSASFGRLDFEYFNTNAQRNRAYLEEKHGMRWLRRHQMPFVSFAHDAAFTAGSREQRREQRALLELHAGVLDDLLRHYRREFDHLHAIVQGMDALRGERTPELDRVAETARGLGAAWQTLRRAGLTAPEGASPAAFAAQAERFAADVHRVVDESFRMHALITAAERAGSVRRGSRLGRVWSLLRHGVPFLLRLRGAVFFGGYPYAPRLKDGYWQRIRAIDELFADRWRIYFDQAPLPGQDAWYDLPAPKTLVLRGGGTRRRRFATTAVIWLFAMRCRFVYFHSVLRMQEHAFGALLRLPFTTRIVDVHGAVPEEFRMHDDFFSGRIYDRHEEAAVKRASAVVVVSEAMRAYLADKFRSALRAEVVVLPIFPGIEPFAGVRPYADGRPVVVYAGGLHAWQQVPKMIDAIERTLDRCDHRFYCTDPDAVTAMLSERALASGRVVVESKTHDELLMRYRECHFGFLLRADNVVNHVACPTKVVEYLAMGIVPIVDTERVGDFAALGMQFVRLQDFVAGRIPDETERARMAAANQQVYGRLRAQREAGAVRLLQINGRRRSGGGGRIAKAMWHVGRLLPEQTVRGRIVRGTWRTLTGRRAAPATTAAAPAGAADPTAMPGRCDVLVQVGHFLAGGLENVVLDLNEVLQAAGYRVGMLVLGKAGAAAERARQQGVEVFVADYTHDAYRAWLRAASPRLVMSHYSIDGALICRELGVPLVQVIHNVYVWLRGEELAAMKASTAATTMFVAVSAFVRDFSVRRIGVPADRCAVIPNGIDIARFRDRKVAEERAHLRQQLGIRDDEFVFLNAAAINHQKNHLSLLRSFLSIREECPRARLVVIGPVYEHELMRECRQFVECHRLADRVTFVGPVVDPHRYYAMADAYVHSAFFEGGQLTALESLTANLPVITVATGFAMHFAGRRGVHVVPAHFDVAAFDGHITRMAASPATEAAFAAAMREVYADPVRPDLPTAVIEAFDRENAYRSYVELVRSLVGGSALTPAALDARSWVTKVADVG